MDDLDGRLRNAFDQPAPLTVDEIRTRAETAAPRDRRPRLVLIGVLVAMIVIAAGVVVVARRDTKTNPRIAVGATTTTSSNAVGTSTVPSGAASGHATVEIELNETTAVADGKPILGTAVIDNQTGHTIDAPSGQCVGWLGVGLSNGQIHYEFSVPAISCAPFKIPTGVSRYPVSVSTEYSSCAQTGTPDDPNLPACLGPEHNQIPALPAGTYTAAVGGAPAGIERPPPITVTLTAPSS